MMFGSKPKTIIEKPSEPILANVPVKPLIRHLIPTHEKETIEYYIIEKSGIRDFAEKTFYNYSLLHRLRTLRVGYYGEPEIRLEWSLWTDGKETLRVRQGRALFSINDETLEATFHPAFFELIGSMNMRLVRIEAPEAWHTTTDVASNRLDPDITLEWSPEWK